jgi:transcriptional regulator EpsA
MTYPSSLKNEELERYFHMVKSAVGIRRHVDLLRWLQGDMQDVVPHEIMLAGWGDFAEGLIYHDIVSAIPGVRTEQASAEALLPLLRGLFDRWVEFGNKPFTLESGEFGFLLGGGGGVACALGGALRDMRSALVHGISDERGNHHCLYVLFSATVAHVERHRHSLEVLLPNIDTAFRQVAHLPRQRQRHRRRASDVAAVKALVEVAAVPVAASVTNSVSDSGAVPAADPPSAEAPGLLSARELEIMEWVRHGKTNQEVGQILDISAFTVKNHLQRIFKKFDVYNRTQAVNRFDKLQANGRK